jgi:polyphosphate kinase 2 (PPK2 family)
MAQKFRSLLPVSEHRKAQTFFESKADYENQLKQLQRGLLQLQRKLHVDRKKLVILFEGPDAAGKGGVIKRMTEYLDPRGVAVQSIGKPNVVEIEQQYMQRFFAKLPEPGVITIFDRSWYGRVFQIRK